MSFATGNNCVVKLTAAAEKDLSAYVTKVTMNLKGHALVDTTTMGQSGHKWSADELEDGSFSVDFMWDKGTDGPYDVLKTISRYTISDGAKAFELGPEGNTAGYPKITGNCWMEGDLPIEVAVGDMIKLTGVNFKVDGTATFGTY